MKSFKEILRLLFATTYLATLLFVLPVSSTISAATPVDTLWTNSNGNPDVIVGKDLDVNNHNGNTDCTNYVADNTKTPAIIGLTVARVTAYSGTWAAGNLQISPTNMRIMNNVSDCVAENNQGGFGLGGYYTGKGLAYGFQVRFGPSNNATYPLSTIPLGDGMVVSRPSNRIGRNISIIKNFNSVASLDVMGTQNELVMHVNPAKEPDQLRYSDNTLIDVKAFAFSRNGQYIVLELPGRGLIRLKLSDMTVLPFASSTAYNNNASDPGYNLAISDDGRYAAKDGSNSAAGFTVYDIKGCVGQPTPINQLFSTGNLSFAGCSERNYAAQINIATAVSTTSPYPGFSNGLNTIRFMPSNNVIEAHNYYKGGSTMRSVAIVAANTSYIKDGYLAMGDSFASGEGDTQGGIYYEAGTDEQGDSDSNGRNLCHLSKRSYPYLLANQLGYSNSTDTPTLDGQFHSVACSGDKSVNVISEQQYSSSFKDKPIKFWIPGINPQNGYITGFADTPRAQFSPSVITISMGGNDVGFADVLTECAAEGTCNTVTDLGKRAQLAERIAVEKKTLVSLYKTLKEVAPNAKIYVVGYPEFVQANNGNCNPNVMLNDQERQMMSEATKYMNQIIQSATTEVGVTYVDVENILSGTNLCSGAVAQIMTVNGITQGDDKKLGVVQQGVLAAKGICVAGSKIQLQTGVCMLANESFHPNEKAHKLYRDRIMVNTNGFTTANPVDVRTTVPYPSDYFGIYAKNYLDELNTNKSPTVVLPEKSRILDYSQTTGYKQANFSMTNFAASSSVEASIHSTPVVLGNFTADVNGKVQGTITIPSTIPAGVHEIHLVGKNILNQTVDYYQQIVVAGPVGDVDGDGIPDAVDKCSFVPQSNQDIDEDGIDDACDGDLATPITKPLAAPVITKINDQPVPTTDPSTNIIPEILMSNNNTQISGMGELDPKNAAPVKVSVKDHNGNLVCEADVIAGLVPGIAPDKTWSCTPAVPLIDGAYKLTATQKVGDRLPSPTSNTVSLTIDTIVPTAPKITDVAEDKTIITDPSDNTKTISNPDTTTADNTPEIKGEAEPGATLHIYEPLAATTSLQGSTLQTISQPPASFACEITVGSDGKWSCQIQAELMDGLHKFVVYQTDKVGNKSVESEIMFDVTAAPTANPTILQVANKPASSVDYILTNINNPQVLGSGIKGANVKITDQNGNNFCEATVDAGSGWFCTPSTLADGKYEVYASQVDGERPISAGSNIARFEVDATAPSAPKFTAVAEDVLPANLETPDNTPIITGEGEPGATIKLFETTASQLLIANSSVCSIVVGVDGKWLCEINYPLTDGIHTFSAYQTDAAGNESQVNEVRFNVTALPLNPPAITSVENTPASSSIYAQITSKTPQINGTGVAGASLTLKDQNNNILCQIIVDNTGQWTCKTPMQIDGKYDLSASQIIGERPNSSASNTAKIEIKTVIAPDPLLTNLYRSRWGDEKRQYTATDKNGKKKTAKLEENKDKIYLERNVSLSKQYFGLNDYDPDGDGWALVGISPESEGKNKQIMKTWVTKVISPTKYGAYIPHISVGLNKSCRQFTTLYLGEVTKTQTKDRDDDDDHEMWYRKLVQENAAAGACSL